MGRKQKLSHNERRIRRKRVWRRFVFVLEILVLLVLIAGLFVFAKMDQMGYENTDTERVEVNDEVVQNEVLTEVLKGYTTIALVGVDSRNGNLDNALSDTMILVSINNDTKKIKLLSLYRDTYLRVRESKDGEDIFGQANTAYARGGSEQFLSMLNKNFDLNIKEFVTVDFTAVAVLTDLLGGIDIKMTVEEVVHMNNYCVETSEVTGLEYEPIKPVAGTYHLNGVQAVAYARIRKTDGMDMRRAARQREVIYKLVDKVKTADLVTLNRIVDEVFPMVKTSLSKTEIIKLGMGMLSYAIEDQAGFPKDHLLGKAVEEAVGIDCVVPVTLESNVIWLHEYLYGQKNYRPSSTVQAYSDWIIEKSGFDESWRLEHSEDGNLDDYLEDVE